MLGYDFLYRLLLFLQRLHHLLLHGLLVLQGCLLLPAAVEQGVLLPPYALQLGVLGLYLPLLGLDHLALRALVGGVFAHEAHTAVHLRKVLRAEDKHQLVLHRALGGKVSHRLYVFCLALRKLSLERGELAFQHTYVAVDVGYLALDGVYGLLVAVNLRAERHQVAEPLLDVGLVGTQQALLLLYFALHPGTLVAQPLY